MSSDSLNHQGKALENQFFAQLDQQLLAKVRDNLDKASEREALAALTKIQNVALLDKLIALGIHPATYAAITFVPLASVAWADGTLDAAERRAILQAAEDHGVPKDGPGIQLLEKWLHHAPGPELLHVWKDYIKELHKIAEPGWFAALKAEILDLAERIAETSGGILGLIQKVSPAEKRKLEELAKAFEL